MRLLPALPLAVFALGLAACQKEPDQPKTAEQVKVEAAKMTRPEPGLYKSTMTISALQIPGMPPKETEQLKTMMTGTAQAREFCLTKEESERGFEDFGKKLAQGKCTYDRFEADSDSLDAKLTCQTAENTTSTVELVGTFTGTNSQMKMKLNAAAPQMAGQSMAMEAEVKSERVGDCPGSEG